MEKRNFIPAPIDNKNLLEDPFEDDVFRDFYQGSDHRKGNNKRHLIGTVSVDTDAIYFDGFVEVKWNWGSNTICIELIACPASEDYFSMKDDFFKYYEGIFKEWECPDNEDLRIQFKREDNKLYVSFYFEVEE